MAGDVNPTLEELHIDRNNLIRKLALYRNRLIQTFGHDVLECGGPRLCPKCFSRNDSEMRREEVRKRVELMRGICENPPPPTEGLKAVVRDYGKYAK